MLVGKSLPEYVFIRIAIGAIRLITPLSVLYCFVFPLVRPRWLAHHRLLWLTLIWPAAEASFFLVVYLPLRVWLQQPAALPPTPPKDQRHVLFQRCINTITDPVLFLRQWFLDAPLVTIKRENVKEFWAWTLMTRKYGDYNNEESVELDTYVDALEEILVRSLEPGYGAARCLRGTLDPVPMQHRPLVWYGV